MEYIDLIERMTEALIQATRSVPGGNKDWDRLIDEAIEASRLTPHQPDAAITSAGAPEVETGGYMIEQWVNNNRWRALYGPFETLEKAREVRERSKITPTRIVLQQKVVIEQ